jgi:hypothetical protein
MLVEWVIWYDDGSSYSSLDGPKDHVPRRGVEAVAMLDPDTGRAIDWGRDWYWWDGENWLSGDQFGVLDFLNQQGVIRYDGRAWNFFKEGEWLQAPDLYAMLFSLLDNNSPSLILAGRCMPNPKFRALYQKIIDDPRLPPKSGSMAQEQPPPGGS